MTPASDTELMQEYADRNSQSAFAELVERHINLVYSVALRYVGNPQDAQDANQEAPKLGHGPHSLYSSR